MDSRVRSGGSVPDKPFTNLGENSSKGWGMHNNSFWEAGPILRRQGGSNMFTSTNFRTSSLFLSVQERQGLLLLIYR